MNTTILNSTITHDNLDSSCGGATDLQLQWFSNFAWWIEGFLQLATGFFGFMANCIVIPILSTRKMTNTFNRLLIMLAIFDNVYVMCSMLEATRKYFVSTDQHLIIFIYFLYQLQSMAFVCSVYTTVLLAIQRYFAISKPLEYYVEGVAATAGGNTWKIVLMYIIPIMMFSAVFNIPKFFEFRIVEEKLTRIHPVTNQTEVLNDTRIGFQPTELRLDENYVFYYVNLGRLFVTGVFPFVSLAALNGAIYRGIKRRQETILLVQSQRPMTNRDQQGLGLCSTFEELILFAIVIIFLLCSLPRVVLNGYELYSIRTIKENIHLDCFRPPLWVMVTTSLVTYLNTLNCSINFIVYCIMCAAFRKAFLQSLSKLKEKVANTFQTTQLWCPKPWKDHSRENSEPFCYWQRGRCPDGGDDDIRMTVSAFPNGDVQRAALI